MPIIDDIAPEARRDACITAADCWAGVAGGGMTSKGEHTLALLIGKHTMVAPLPPAQVALILAYGAWYESIYTHCGAILARIESGEDARFDPSVPGTCPTTIWAIYAAGQV